MESVRDRLLALGALTVLLPLAPFADLSVATTIAFHAMSILGAGAALAALAALVPAIGWLFLDRLRAQAEARQYAQALFLEREIFRTTDRRALLLLVSRFERAAVILADKGLSQYTPAPELERIASAMKPLLGNQGPAAAFEIAFDALQALLRARGVAASQTRNELDDAVVMEKGI